jgi:hypothetical protein
VGRADHHGRPRRARPRRHRPRLAAGVRQRPGVPRRGTLSGRRGLLLRARPARRRRRGHRRHQPRHARHRRHRGARGAARPRCGGGRRGPQPRRPGDVGGHR